MLSSYEIRLILDEVEIILEQNKILNNNCELPHFMYEKNLERLQVLYAYLNDEKTLIMRSHLQLITA